MKQKNKLLSQRRMLCFFESMKATLCISDLLYFDALLVFQVSESNIEVIQKLLDADLIVNGQSFFDLNDHIASMSDYPFEPRNVKDLMDSALKYVRGNVRRLAVKARLHDVNAIPYYLLEDFDNAFETGNNKVMSIIYRELPTLDNSNLKIDYLIEFLCDEETQIKRRRLFSWQNDIENKIEKSEIKSEHVPDMIAERIDTYVEHLKLSELKFKIGISECLLNLPREIILSLTGVGLPKAIKNMLEFKKRELELKEAELKAPGREIAYIVHAKRKFSHEN